MQCLFSCLQKQDEATSKMPCGEGVSGSAGVAFRGVILRKRQGRWWLFSHGEGGVLWDIEGRETSHFESFQS